MEVHDPFHVVAETDSTNLRSTEWHGPDLGLMALDLTSTFLRQPAASTTRAQFCFFLHF